MAKRSRLAVVLACVGIVCLAGGELFCLLGPIQYEHTIHIICHAIFYTGAALVATAALVEIRDRTRRLHDASEVETE